MSAANQTLDLREAPSQPARPAGAKRRWEAADTVIALSGGLIFIIFAIFALLCWQGYGQSIEGAKKRAQTSADIMATQGEWLLGAGRTALRLVEERLALEPAVIDAGVKADLDAALKGLPTGASLAIYDPAGQVVENGGSPSLPANIADRVYYTEVASGEQAETVAPQEADAATGAPLIVMSRRIGGEVNAGIIVLAIPAAALDAFWSAQGLTGEATISLLREDGFVVARYPALPQTINVAEGSPYWSDIVANEKGTYDSGRSPADGISRIVGYSHISGYGVIAIGSVSKESVLAGLWVAIVTVLWLLVPISIALFGGSLLTAHLLRRSAETQRTLAAALSHNEVLFREIHHRVKNNLQSVASLLQMQPIPREIKANMGQRIAAMSAVHEHIYRSNDFETVRVREYLQTLVASLRAGADSRVEVVEGFEDLAVDRDAATPLGLIVNEVVSNAFKHAFPDGREGRIVVTLEHRGTDRGLLVIEDNGVGYDPEAPAKGIGRRLITALTQQLGGEATVEAKAGGGSRFSLSFPLASAA